MASILIVDETVVVVSREVLAVALADRTRWSAWWPGLEVTVAVDRGVEGMAWAVMGELVGSADVRLLGNEGGVLIRYVLDADPARPGSRTVGRRLPDSPHGRRQRESMRRRQQLAWQNALWSLREELEGSEA